MCHRWRLFTSHKAEVIALIKALVQLGSAFTKVYLLAAPTMVKIATAIIKATTAIIDFTNHLPGGADVLGITLLAGKMGVLRPLLLGAADNAGLLEHAVGGVGNAVRSGLAMLGRYAAALFGIGPAGAAAEGGEDAAAFGAGALDIALGVGVVGALIAVGYGLYMLVTHWSQSWAAIKRVMGDAEKFIKRDANEISIAIAGTTGPMGIVLVAALQLWVHWHTVWSKIGPTVKQAARDVKDGIDLIVTGVETGWDLVSGLTKGAWDLINGFTKAGVDLVVGTIKLGVDLLTGNWKGAWDTVKSTARTAWQDITGGLAGFINGIVGGLKGAWNSVKSDATTAWNDLVSFFESIETTILSVFSGAGGWLLSVGKAIIQGLVNGITSMIGAVKSAVSSVVSGVKDVVTLGGLIGSPSPWFPRRPDDRPGAGQWPGRQ